MPLVRSVRPTAVLHLAGMSSPVRARADTARRLGRQPVRDDEPRQRRCCEHAPEARFINAGSAEIYGGSFNAEADVTRRTGNVARPAATPTRPPRRPPISCWVEMSEAVGLAAVRFRPFNHTGPGPIDGFRGSRLRGPDRCRRARSACEPVIRVGNLDARRDFLDVRDVAEAYVRAVTAPSIAARRDPEPRLGPAAPHWRRTWTRCCGLSQRRRSASSATRP